MGAGESMYQLMSVIHDVTTSEGINSLGIYDMLHGWEQLSMTTIESPQTRNEKGIRRAHSSATSKM